VPLGITGMVYLFCDPAVLFVTGRAQPEKVSALNTTSSTTDFRMTNLPFISPPNVSEAEQRSNRRLPLIALKWFAQGRQRSCSTKDR